VNRIFKFLDWFIPDAAKHDRSELGLARNFVFTHLCGPTLAQSISVFLYISDPDPGIVCWTVIACIWSFWLLPFVLKLTGNLQLVALVSVQTLAFASLFGSYHYGGVSSPFMPWLLVSLLLGFFYFSERPRLIVGLFSFNLLGFFGAYALDDFRTQVPLEEMTTVGSLSVFSAIVYMSWMAIYYSIVIAGRSELEREEERHRATAERLRETKDLADQANKAKSIFLAKMSHELRTPLNAVIGYSELLLEDVEMKGGGETKLADLKRINSAGRHLLSLVTDVLDLSKIESNAMDLKLETFDLAGLIEEVIANARPLMERGHNRLVVKSGENLGMLQTDQTKLRQAALNLLSNAAKFSENGTVTLDVRRERKPAGDWVQIEVRDTGIGIAAENLGKLFQNFAQATATTSVQYGGTGLGLALSQKLCALMGGGIAVTSELGRGSTFTIRVPAVATAEQPEHDASTADLSETWRSAPSSLALAS
jgi:signal transduction histidine kinase